LTLWFFASGDQEDGTVEELTAAFKGYAAYYGTYSVDELAGVITHHVDASMFPNWVGTDQRREAVLEGSRLTLSTRLPWHEGKEWLFRLVWRRLEAE
jgi:Lipocalin-like domain